MMLNFKTVFILLFAYGVGISIPLAQAQPVPALTQAQEVETAQVVSITPEATPEAVPEDEPKNTTQDIGRLIPIFDLTLNAKPDFPPCVGLSYKSAQGGSCMTIRDPKEYQSMPFFKYVNKIANIWYSRYDEQRKVPRLMVHEVPLLGLDEEGRLVYLMTYTRSDEAAQEEIFAMLKGLFGEYDITLTKEDRWDPAPMKVIDDDWYSSQVGTPIFFWSNDEVWVRYIVKSKSRESGILVIGLKRILTSDRIPPIYSY